MGVSDEPRHFDRAEWVKEKAEKMNCIVLKTHDLDMKDSHDALMKKLNDNDFDPKKDKIHISFIDHGSDGKLPFSNSEFITYKKALLDLDERLPSGTDITYSSHICWPQFAETLINTNFKNIASMCGGSSVSADNLSNAWGGTKDSSRLAEYLPAGWNYWSSQYSSDKKGTWKQMIGWDESPNAKDAMSKINMFNFHYMNLGKDMGNLRDGSSLSSQTFLKNKISGWFKAGNPFEEEPTIESSYENLVDRESSNLNHKERLCKKKTNKLAPISELENIFNQINTISIQTEIDKLAKKNNLYKAYSTLYKNSFQYMKENGKSFKQLIRKFVKSQKDLDIEWERENKLIEEGKGSYSKVERIQAEMESLESQKNGSLREGLVHLYRMKDVERIVKVNDIDPKSLKEFEKLMACERAYALDKF
jgi:hypothetical protein